jgi:hypothetical protein
MTAALSRRRLLRGSLGGAAVTIALPFLDAFLNSSGTALAAGGAPLPVRFGTWFWGCGINPQRWNPATAGAGYEITPELKPIEAVKDRVSILSGFNVLLDGRANHVHVSGTFGLRTGTPPTKFAEIEAPTLDVLISAAVGQGTRFRSIELTSTGESKHSYSRQSTSVINPSEGSPLAFYTRIFGPEFQDPNAGEFTPDPRTLIRHSVLSATRDDRERLLARVGAADRARLDEYFTSVRQLENQTRVFNMVFSEATSSLRKAGSNAIHHTLTHEEQVDRDLGYQPQATWFEMRAMEAWASFVATLSSIREGDGTLLDNCLVMAHSDSSFAKAHDVIGIPVMLAGRAGGKVRQGIHVKGGGDPISRIGLTMQQVMGVPVDKWGTQSMQTGKAVSEILV